ncbi:MAG: histidine phosphatase family protein [Gaiellales bacterium]
MHGQQHEVRAGETSIGWCVYLLRHGSAGERAGWVGDDLARPLDPEGVEQARALAAAFSGSCVSRIVSSPAIRCVQSVEPLAARLSLPIETSRGVGTGAGAGAARAVIGGLEPGTLICTHRELFELLFDGAVTCAKGGTWIARRAGDGLVPASYVEPPHDGALAGARRLAAGEPAPAGGSG